MGVALSGPLTVFDKIYTLPMLTIKEGKGKEDLSLLFDNLDLSI